MSRKPIIYSCLWIVACLAFFCALATGSLRAAESESDVKSAYLFNFARLVEWPASATSGPFIIVVLGGSEVAADVAGAIVGEKLGARSVVVRPGSVNDPAALRAAHLVYCAVDDEARIAELLAITGGRPILTVGEGEAFADRGGVVAFIREGDTVKFVLNQKAAMRQSLVLSSRLGRVARRVISK